MGTTHLVQDRVEWWALVHMVMNIRDSYNPEVPWKAEELPASKEEHCCMESFNLSFEETVSL
jgi:hypothetical protein